MTLRPFFNYYGGKWRAAPAYPAPRYDTILEPFAGAAGYATRHWRKRVVLVEKNPVVAALWRYLTRVSSADVRRIPLLEDDSQRVQDLTCCDEARALVGFWVNKGSTAPRNQLSTWSQLPVFRKQFWGSEVRERVARQVDRIRHWKVIEGDYSSAPDVDATWFVDPPYQDGGEHYPCASTAIDFGHLAGWCRARRGQVMVCERAGATWLPFRSIGRFKSSVGRQKSARYCEEAIWTNQPDGQQVLRWEAV